MNKFLSALTGLAFLFAASAAIADDAAGKIKAVNEENQTITLEDGVTFHLAEGISMDNLKPGTEVTVSYEESEGKKVATKVQAAE